MKKPSLPTIPEDSIFEETAAETPQILTKELLENNAELAKIRSNLANAFAGGVVKEATKNAAEKIAIMQPQIDQAFAQANITEEQFMASAENFAADLEKNFVIDVAGAKMAFAEIVPVLRGTQDNKQNIVSSAQQKTADTILNTFADLAKKILAGKLTSNALQESRAIENLLTHFAFLGLGVERDFIQSWELALPALEQFMENIAPEKQQVVDDTVKARFAKSNNADVDEKKSEEQQPKEQNNPPITESNPEPNQAEELAKVEKENAETAEESKQKEQNSAVNTPEQITSKNSVVKKSETMSHKKLETLMLSSVKPILRVGIAVALSFAVPGAGFALAALFLALTEDKDQEKQAEKEQDFLPQNRPSSYVDTIETAAGKQAQNVVDQEQQLEQDQKMVLEQNLQSLKRVEEQQAEAPEPEAEAEAEKIPADSKQTPATEEEQVKAAAIAAAKNLPPMEETKHGTKHYGRGVPSLVANQSKEQSA